MEDDRERIALWHEWCGYKLMPDVSYQKFLMRCGEGANGKQVCTDVLEALLGPDNVSHVPLEQFGQRFALWPTVGKLANIITEVGELARTDEGVFKQFVAGDPVSIDRKGLSILKNRPTARVTIMCNTLPGWFDPTAGDLARRVVEFGRRTTRSPTGVQLPREAPPGWTRAGWRDRLLQLADACESVQLEKARHYRAVAAGREDLRPC